MVCPISGLAGPTVIVCPISGLDGPTVMVLPGLAITLAVPVCSLICSKADTTCVFCCPHCFLAAWMLGSPGLVTASFTLVARNDLLLM